MHASVHTDTACKNYRHTEAHGQHFPRFWWYSGTDIKLHAQKKFTYSHATPSALTQQAILLSQLSGHPSSGEKVCPAGMRGLIHPGENRNVSSNDDSKPQCQNTFAL